MLFGSTHSEGFPVKAIRWLDKRLSTRALAGICALVIMAGFSLYVYINITGDISATIHGDGNRIVVKGIKYQCPDGWVETAGVDPQSNQQILSCTNGRYIITAREDAAPTAFDTLSGTFVDASQFK